MRSTPFRENGFFRLLALLYLFSADFAMDFCKKKALPRHVLHAQQGFLCCFLHNLADFMAYRHN
jgi:hypothetical protein